MAWNYRPKRGLRETMEFIEANSRQLKNGCVIFTGNLRDGYGHVRCEGKMQNAHRVAYRDRHGDIPDEIQVLHTCDNRPCFADGHLVLGSNTKNIDDKCVRDRSGKKLNIAKVRRIKRLLARGLTHQEIGERFGVGQPSITKIARGQRWRHVNL